MAVGLYLIFRAHASGPPTLQDLGYIDITTRGACTSCSADVNTAAIEQSLQDAYNSTVAGTPLAVYVPGGTYQVSDTIDMHIPCTPPDAQTACSASNNQPSHQRPAYQIIGSTKTGSRPIIKLVPDAGDTSFSKPGNPKPVFQAWECKDAACSGNDPNQNYNQIIRNLEVDISGNAGAIGIEMRGAEGCNIQNVKIDALNAFAGINDLPGSGGTIEDLEVDNGQYGVYAPDAQPSPTITGLTLTGQTQSAVSYDGTSPLTIVGFNISQTSGTAITNLALAGAGTGMSNQEGASNLDLIDGTVAFTGGSNNVVISHTDRNIYVKNVYVKNAGHIATDLSGQTPASQDAISNISGQWTLINEYARTKNYANPVQLVNGSLVANTTVTLNQTTNNPTPPKDLVSRNSIADAVPTFEDYGVKNAKTDFGAVGDGTTDDTVALQNAASSGAKVFLPAGTYRISGTLRLAAATKFFGVTDNQSVIAATPTWAARSGAFTVINGAKICSETTLTAPTEVDGQIPMITTVNDPAAETVLADIKILMPASSSCINAITWQAGHNSVVSYPWITPEHYNDGSGQPNYSRQRVIITGSGGGRWYDMRGEVGYDVTNPASRVLLVDGTTEPLEFYALHGQYQISDANNEIRNASNVTIYGFKSENLNSSSTAILEINNSHNVAVYGHLSNAAMDSGLGMIEINNSSNVLLANIARFVGGSDVITGGSDWYYIRDTEGAITTGITAETDGALFKNGTYTTPNFDSCVPGAYPNMAGDVNGDCVVDVKDLTLLAANYRKGNTRTQGDLNGDGTIDIQDYATMAINWGG